MYDFLHGTLASKTPAGVTIQVGGIGYAVQVPLSTFSALPEPGQRVRLLTHLYHREDQLKLYGFATEAERTAAIDKYLKDARKRAQTIR